MQSRGTTDIEAAVRAIGNEKKFADYRRFGLEVVKTIATALGMPYSRAFGRPGCNYGFTKGRAWQKTHRPLRGAIKQMMASK